MRKRVLVFLFSSVAANALAQPLTVTTTTPVDHHAVAMVGVTYGLNGSAFSKKNIGFSLNVLSSNQEYKWVLGAGASFYPWSDKQFGLGIGAGRNFNDSNCLVSWDFLQSAPTATCGVTNTKPKEVTTTGVLNPD